MRRLGFIGIVAMGTRNHEKDAWTWRLLRLKKNSQLLSGRLIVFYLVVQARPPYLSLRLLPVELHVSHGDGGLMF